MNKPEQPEWDGIAEKWLEKESVRVSVLTDLQTLIKEIISSRDTYWKERVRKEVEGIPRVNPDDSNQNYTSGQQAEIRAYNRAFDDILQALDNLK